jgi:hypothetical protein
LVDYLSKFALDKQAGKIVFEEFVDGSVASADSFTVKAVYDFFLVLKIWYLAFLVL